MKNAELRMANAEWSSFTCADQGCHPERSEGSQLCGTGAACIAEIHLRQLFESAVAACTRSVAKGSFGMRCRANAYDNTQTSDRDSILSTNQQLRADVQSRADVRPTPLSLTFEP